MKRYKEDGSNQSTLYEIRMTPTPPNGVPLLRQKEYPTPPNGDEPYPEEPEVSKDTISAYERKKEFVLFSQNSTSVTASVIGDFLELGWNPRKDETVETFRKWLADLASVHGMTAEQMRAESTRWKLYWLTREKKKNLKACFMNNPSLPNNKKKWAR